MSDAQHLPVTGILFQSYKVSEDRIQFCPNFCENVTVIHDFCQAADR